MRVVGACCRPNGIDICSYVSLLYNLTIASTDEQYANLLNVSTITLSSSACCGNILINLISFSDNTLYTLVILSSDDDITLLKREETLLSCALSFCLSFFPFFCSKIHLVERHCFTKKTNNYPSI